VVNRQFYSVGSSALVGLISLPAPGLGGNHVDIHRPPVSDRLAALIAPLAVDRRRHVLAMASRAASWDAFVAELAAGGFPLQSLAVEAGLAPAADRAA